MKKTLVYHVQPPPISYEIEFKPHLLKECASLIPFIAKQGSKVAIVSNSLVGSLYGHALCRSLNELKIETHLFLLPDGEKYKSRTSKEQIENQMFEKKIGRDSCLIALGGGVVMDLAGFIAATYCRGIPLLLIPTSLLGMVDACMGGKTGINLPEGKNLLGSIYQPQKVFIDTFFLTTLAKKEVKNGMAEMIKHALIKDAQFFAYLHKHAQALLDLDMQKIEEAIYMSCQIKKQIVEIDEKETGPRRLLNFGHTIGHALEKLTQYQLAHGEAVAIGLVVESYLSYLEGYLNFHAVELILEMIEKFQFSFEFIGEFSLEELMEAMNLDKKSRANQVRFVMIDKIGSSLEFKGEYCAPANFDHMKAALKWMCDDLCSYSGTYRRKN